MQTQSPRAAQPQSLAKCRVLAVGEGLHFCIDSDRLVSSAEHCCCAPGSREDVCVSF